MYPSSFNNLVESLKFFPGIGEKTAIRMAFSILEMDEEKVSLLSENLIDMKKKINRCPVCNGFIEDNSCNICNNNSRDDDVLCVVEDPKSVFLFEELKVFNGKYHVLNGLISPLDGINPEDIGLDTLMDRIKKENYKEIILAFKPCIEGETTSLYIKRILDGLNINITKIASGIPMGADMEYIDSLTLERALSDRKNVE